MGVLMCDRGDCENIMCDYYSYSNGYLCVTCYNELEESRPTCNLSIKAFMLSPKEDDANYWDSSIMDTFERRD